MSKRIYGNEYGFQTRAVHTGNDVVILSIILDTFFTNDFKQQYLHIHSIVFS